MSSDIQLTTVLSTLGYTPDQIRAAKDAVAKVEGERLANIAAMINTSALLSPMQAAAQSKRHAAELRQLDGMIFHASRGTFRLPKDGSCVNIYEVNAAIKNAPHDTRMSIKSGLFSLGLIGR